MLFYLSTNHFLLLHWTMYSHRQYPDLVAWLRENKDNGDLFVPYHKYVELYSYVDIFIELFPQGAVVIAENGREASLFMKELRRLLALQLPAETLESASPSTVRYTTCSWFVETVLNLRGGPGPTTQVCIFHNNMQHLPSVLPMLAELRTKLIWFSNDAKDSGHDYYISQLCTSFNWKE